MPRSTRVSERPIRGGHLEPTYIVNQPDDPVTIQLPSGTIVPVVMPASHRDAFGRHRMTEPYGLFDSKQIFDNLPLLWDDQQTAGTGTSSTHSVNRASSTLQVSASTAGTRVRQTKQAFNYQPGKSQLALFTGVMGSASAGITRRIGLFNENNGLYFELNGSTLSVVIRSNVSGTPNNTVVNQADWNLDKLDGTGSSGITIDTSKAQIFVIDFEWLGTGVVRFGFFAQGIPVYCHDFFNANVASSVYMSTPNLPARYEISNDGTGAQSTLEAICTSIMSEGGQEDIGRLTYISTGSTPLAASTAGSLYAVLGIRLKSSYYGQTVEWVSVDMLESGNGSLEYVLLLNPTVAGSFTYADVANSSLQRALGVTANTVTGGTAIDGGWVAGKTALTAPGHNAIGLGRTIAGVLDTIVVCARPLTNNQNVYCGITLREL